MKVTILDDYQDVIKTLDCFELCNDREPKILTKGYDPLTRLPNLKLISPTDVLTLYLRLDEQTKQSVSEQDSRLMKPETLSLESIVRAGGIYFGTRNP